MKKKMPKARLRVSAVKISKEFEKSKIKVLPDYLTVIIYKVLVKLSLWLAAL